ncbi:MAG: NHLP bacteriocin export ABC transporter permease/ATPase subunit [Lachnospiraceae bacterium]|nr:NHLP bacteriocin export ABC transporter permease/ATPase subunit [Lachnospiraceae bacterium]
MGWFDEQIRQRKISDQELFEDAVARMAAAIASGTDTAGFISTRAVTKDAINDILKYYRLRPAEIPDTVRDPDEQLAWAMRPAGLMYRSVRLTGSWWEDASGPMIVYRKEDGSPVAVYPKQLRGYWFRDAGGRKVNMDKKKAALLEEDAICFYTPLPASEIGIPELMSFIKGCLNGGDLLLFLFFTLLMTLFSMMAPQITRLLTGFVLKSGNMTLLWGTAALMLSAAISSQIMSAARNLSLHRMETKVSLSVEAAVTMRMINLPAPFFKKYSVGDLAMRSQSVSELCTLLIGEVFSSSVLSLVSLLYIAQIFDFAPGLALPALLVLLATLGVTVFTTLLQSRINRQLLEAQAKEQGLSISLITGVQKIRLAGAEKRAFSKWARTYAEEAQVAYDPPMLLKIAPALQLTVSVCGAAALYWFAVSTGVGQSEYIAFSSSYGLVTGAFATLSGIAVSASRIRPILEMTEPILKTVPETPEGKEMLTKLSGMIELNNLWFRYNENAPYVAKGLNLKIRSGEYVAIVGRTGCGKSTLFRLLLGFEKPERGAVYFDGRDLSRIDLASLRRKIGTVLQNGGLFQGDIYSNIVICAPQLTIDDAWEAAGLAGIADDIRAMPMGMHTIIGEGMGGISGGQKQRLMIARAVAPKPSILMFDEATSALDNKTQKQVAEALDGLKCTRIVIAHRLSTIKHCDRILVLEDGQIAEEGTYDQLIEKNGLFATLVKRQRLDTNE